ncbi:MAG: T9SS type A sorting domain-containing protein [candidate division WOR-3 bacterium]|nr:T9SS type A sorting domain-containing protein [candidate division WOR-3 bacterium]
MMLPLLFAFSDEVKIAPMHPSKGGKGSASQVNTAGITVVEMPHTGANADLEKTCRISTNTLQLFAPKLVYRPSDNSLRLVFGSKLTGSDWNNVVCADADPQTNVRNHDVWITSYVGGSWTTAINLTNTPSACETWPDAPNYIYSDTLPILYLYDPQCGSSLFGEGAQIVSPWIVSQRSINSNFNEVKNDTAGKSDYDYPRNASYRWIAVSKNGLNIHFAYMNRGTSGSIRKEFYNFFDASTGSWLDPTGVGVEAVPDNGNGFGTLSLLANNAALISAHVPPSLQARAVRDQSEGAASFSAPINLPNTAAGNCRSPFIYAIDDNNWILWCRKDGAGTNNEVLFRTTDGGSTWTSEGALPIETDQGFLERGTIISAVNNPNLVVWVIARESDTASYDPGLYYYYSTNGGANWTGPITIFPETPERNLQNDPPTEQNPYCFVWVTRPSAVIDNSGNLHVAWEEMCFDGTATGDTLRPYSRIKYWSGPVSVSETPNSKISYKFDAKSKKLEFNLPNATNYELKIYNSSGVLVRNYKLSNNYIYLRELNRGIYFFHIGNLKGKIVIQ